MAFARAMFVEGEAKFAFGQACIAGSSAFVGLGLDPASGPGEFLLQFSIKKPVIVTGFFFSKDGNQNFVFLCFFGNCAG